MRQLLPEPVRLIESRAELEQAYATPGTPSLRANFVVSLDGAVEVEGHSAGLGSPADRAVLACLRGLSDVILVGASTVRRENYGPARVRPEARRRRAARGQQPLPTIAVVSGTAELDPTSRLFTEQPDGVAAPRPVILTCDAAPRERRARLAEVAQVEVCGAASVDLPAALALLRARGLAQVTCEGGPILLGALVGGGLVDELCLSHAPVLVGPGHRGLLGTPWPDATGAPWVEPSRWRLDFLAEGDGMLFARYHPAGAAGPAR